MTSRLALGTAQFGFAYGVANKSGKVEIKEAAEILRLSTTSGIDTLDTAIVYGESEQTLGTLGVGHWKVVTKLPELPQDVSIPEWVDAAVEASLHRLKVSRLYGVLLHRPRQLLESHGAAIWQAMTRLRDRGVVEKIGVSVYSPEELGDLWRHFPVDIVQAPLSIVDRRMIRSGLLARLHKEGVEVHARSVFLQGVLLMPRAERHAKFGTWDELWSRWDEWLEAECLTPLQASLAFALSHSEIARVIVGVDGISQLREIISVANSERKIAFPDHIESTDLSLVNPSHWGKR